MKILVIEDEPKVASFLKQGLEEQTYEVDVAYDGQTGKRLAMNNEYDVILMDVIIPYINGLELCKELRANQVQTAVLMLTALGTTDDKITGFDVGADDYLVKPFAFNELLARIKALVKRTRSGGQTGNVLKVADLELNLDQRNVRRGGKVVDLTAKEFALLEYFIRNKGKVLTRPDIARKVWDINFDTGTNVVDVYVNFLRKKIDKEFPIKLLHTHIGVGYILKDEAA